MSENLDSPKIFLLAMVDVMESKQWLLGQHTENCNHGTITLRVHMMQPGQVIHLPS